MSTHNVIELPGYRNWCVAITRELACWHQSVWSSTTCGVWAKKKKTQVLKTFQDSATNLRRWLHVRSWLCTHWLRQTASCSAVAGGSPRWWGKGPAKNRSTVRTGRCGFFDGAVGRVAEFGVFQLVHEEVAAVTSSRTELHLDRVH